jgi:hypothetical protein
LQNRIRRNTSGDETRSGFGVRRSSAPHELAGGFPLVDAPVVPKQAKGDILVQCIARETMGGPFLGRPALDKEPQGDEAVVTGLSKRFYVGYSESLVFFQRPLALSCHPRIAPFRLSFGGGHAEGVRCLVPEEGGPDARGTRHGRHHDSSPTGLRWDTSRLCMSDLGNPSRSISRTNAMRTGA